MIFLLTKINRVLIEFQKKEFIILKKYFLLSGLWMQYLLVVLMHSGTESKEVELVDWYNFIPYRFLYSAHYQSIQVPVCIVLSNMTNAVSVTLSVLLCSHQWETRYNQKPRSMDIKLKRQWIPSPFLGLHMNLICIQAIEIIHVYFSFQQSCQWGIYPRCSDRSWGTWWIKQLAQGHEDSARNSWIQFQCSIPLISLPIFRSHFTCPSVHSVPTFMSNPRNKVALSFRVYITSGKLNRL